MFKIKNGFLWAWCFPQMALGYALQKITKARKVGDHYEYDIPFGSVTLGVYIFLSPNHWNDEEILLHEIGHTKQSLLLGWLYLFVIGIPSIVWASCFGWYRKKYNVSYYDFYTERWANKLAGIDKRED